MWCVSGLMPGHIHYTVLDVYVLSTIHTKYIQAPSRDDTHLFVSHQSILARVCGFEGGVDREGQKKQE